MKIIIHRGINQIGGCITEVATDKARIFIDFGQNLPDNNGVTEDQFATPEKVAELTKGVDAIFYTHYHGDHIGLFHLYNHYFLFKPPNGILITFRFPLYESCHRKDLL